MSHTKAQRHKDKKLMTEYEGDMRILILGGNGMLGHQLFKHLAEDHEVKVTLRQDLSVYEKFNLFHPDNSFSGINVRSADQLIEVLGEFQPQAIVNAVGIIKQRSCARESIQVWKSIHCFPTVWRCSVKPSTQG